VRDSAAHYINASPVLAKQVLEIASATVKNFILASSDWFGHDFSESLSLVLPLAFINARKEIDAVVMTAGENRLLKYLQNLAACDPGSKSHYSVAIRLEVKFERSKLSTAPRVQITKDPDAVKIILTEENLRERYPWDYKGLAAKCAERYHDFKQDRTFHEIRKPLMGDDRYVHSRYLDPGNPKSGRKHFYSPAIFDVLDKDYMRR
jgi:hypothetical protein